MTGIETWHMIAPVLLREKYRCDMETFMDVYIKVFHELTRLDENHDDK